MSLRLNGSTSGYVEIDAPAAAGSNTLTLPTGNGTSGQVLSTNGSGALSWVQGGRILQVVQAVKTDTASTTSTSWSDISGLSVSITPTSGSSKILVRYDCTAATEGSSFSGGIKLQRNGTDIFLGDTAGNRTRATSWIWSDSLSYTMWPVSNQFLDSPATTSSLTYKLQFLAAYSGRPVYINRSFTDDDFTTRGRVPSQITVMEVAG